MSFQLRYKRQKEKSPLLDTMRQVLPILHKRLDLSISDSTQASCSLQKQILKIFYSLVQVTLLIKFVI